MYDRGNGSAAPTPLNGKTLARLRAEMKVYDEQGLSDALTKMEGGQPSNPPFRARKRALKMVVGGAVMLAALWLWRSGCSCASIICADETVNELPSPDGSRIARVFVRNCGATTDFATFVAVIARHWMLPDSSETVFVGSAIGDGPRGPGGGPEARVRWRTSRDLVVSHHSATGVSRADFKALDVTVTYEKF